MRGSADDNVIPIGSMVPLTGPSAADGAEFRNGVMMAVDEINDRGGILGKRLQPIFADTKMQTAEEVTAAARWLIDRHQVHAIVNGYNIGTQNSEYEAVADAGILYIHHNTLLQHHDTVISDPDRYFGCFMADPAEYWYGQGFIKFISWLRDTGQWVPESNRIAIVSGSKPYSIVIANAMAAAAVQFGWQLAFGPQVVLTPTTEWRDVLKQVRAVKPAVIANTHFYTGDLAHFHLQFMEEPTNSLVYLQYGAMHQSFSDITQAKGVGVIVSTMIGLLRDDIGKHFSELYLARFGQGSTPQVGCQSHTAMHHYAVAASIAGGTGGPGDFEQNRKIARALLQTVYRGVVGCVRYHPDWQAAVPYPDFVQDPSLGTPHLFYQVHSQKGVLGLVAPEPYNTERFVVPSWFST